MKEGKERALRAQHFSYGGEEKRASGEETFEGNKGASHVDMWGECSRPT